MREGCRKRDSGICSMLMASRGRGGNGPDWLGMEVAGDENRKAAWRCSSDAQIEGENFAAHRIEGCDRGDRRGGEGIGLRQWHVLFKCAAYHRGRDVNRRPFDVTLDVATI